MGTIRKLIVEVVDARDLVPKDGHGASSPYVILDFHGQRRKTRTVMRDLNPSWNETLEFNVGKTSDVLGDMLELDVFHDKNIGPTTRNNFLGRVRLSSSQFVKKGEEALIYYPLEKKNLLSWIQGEIGMKIYFADELVPPPPPPTPPPEEAKPLPAPPAEKDNEAPPTEEPPNRQVAAADNSGPPAAAAQEETAPADQNPHDLVMASVASGFIPEVKVNSINAAQPIRFVSDRSDDDRPTVERSSFDLVEKMHFLFVRVVKARSLPTAAGSPVAKITVSGCHVVSKPARRTKFFEWDHTFAFSHDSPPADNSSSTGILEVSVWDHDFLGGICFDVGEIPLRDPPDSSLAPQWYRLEGGARGAGDLMLATWIGTQADESFPDAWKTGNNPNSRSKVYQSPKLWYLRSTVIEAQDIISMPPMPLKESSSYSYQVKVQLGFQVQRTKPALTSSPSWNEELMFVAAEPFTEHNELVFSLIETRHPKAVVGVARIPLASVERRVDNRNVASRWCTLEDPNEPEKRVYRGRVHLRLCFDGGYHVMDEVANACSDYRPTARQLWKPPVGTVELGVIGCKNLFPMKTMTGKGSADAYAVVKYGDKWARTRTISDSLNPRWNEQYTWRVYDPSTVLTVGVFGVSESDDFRIGKVRVRISTLTTGKVYKSVFPMMLLSPGGLRKMGEIELAVRFARAAPTLDFLHVYSQPLLPTMHHLKPIGVAQQEALRAVAVKMVSAHLSRSEPPLGREVVTYMLDSESSAFSMRRVRANWLRIVNVIGGVIDVVRWVEDTRSWKNTTATMLVHALLVTLVWVPDLIVPTLALYVFAVGAWNYRFRSGAGLPHFDPKMSLAEAVDRDELDEEFDAMPCGRADETVRARYDRMRMLGARVQALLGDLATQGERMQALVTWRDPRATGIFVGLCLIVAFVLCLVPSKMVAMAFGSYYLRHPIFRDPMPSPALNFFRRLPSLSDRML